MDESAKKLFNALKIIFDEQNADLKNELKDLKNTIASKDKEISNLKNKVSTLQVQHKKSLTEWTNWNKDNIKTR